MTVKPYEGQRPRLGQGVYIDDTALVIGNVSIGNDVSVWPMAVVRGDVHSIKIGDESNVQDGSVLHVSHAGNYSPNGFPLVIGRGVTIGHRAVVHGCSVGDSCLIGIGSILMDGAILEDRVMVGAGSLVPQGKRLASEHLYLGSPVKRVRPLKQAELDFLMYSAKHYVQLKDRHLDEWGSMD